MLVLEILIDIRDVGVAALTRLFMVQLRFIHFFIYEVAIVQALLFNGLCMIQNLVGASIPSLALLWLSLQLIVPVVLLSDIYLFIITEFFLQRLE